ERALLAGPHGERSAALEDALLEQPAARDERHAQHLGPGARAHRAHHGGHLTRFYRRLDKRRHGNPPALQGDAHTTTSRRAVLEGAADFGVERGAVPARTYCARRTGKVPRRWKKSVRGEIRLGRCGSVPAAMALDARAERLEIPDAHLADRLIALGRQRDREHLAEIADPRPEPLGVPLVAPFREHGLEVLIAVALEQVGEHRSLGLIAIVERLDQHRVLKHAGRRQELAWIDDAHRLAALMHLDAARPGEPHDPQELGPGGEQLTDLL